VTVDMKRKGLAKVDPPELNQKIWNRCIAVWP
jgi:hypothetical protein